MDRIQAQKELEAAEAESNRIAAKFGGRSEEYYNAKLKEEEALDNWKEAVELAICEPLVL